MKKEQLITQATTLYANDNEVYTEYSDKALRMIEEMNRRMLAREDIHQLIGKDNAQMMQDNHANHVRFIASILKSFQPEVLVETILWVFRAYRSHGFTTNYWSAQLNTWMGILEDKLTEKTFQKVEPIYVWMQVNIPSFVECSDEALESNLSMH